MEKRVQIPSARYSLTGRERSQASSKPERSCRTRAGAWRSASPSVSYTHLDVYKRQLYDTALQWKRDGASPNSEASDSAG